MGPNTPRDYIHPQGSRGHTSDSSQDDCYELEYPTTLQMTRDGPVHDKGVVLEILAIRAPFDLDQDTVEDLDQDTVEDLDQDTVEDLDQDTVEDLGQGTLEGIGDAQQDAPVISRRRGPTLAAVDDDGQIVGTIINRATQLLTCINQGVAYVAEVLSETDGVNRVRIRAARVPSEEDRFEVEGAVAPGRFPLGVDDKSSTSAEVTVGSNCLLKNGLCELRSLLRVPVSLEGCVYPDGTVAVSAP